MARAGDRTAGVRRRPKDRKAQIARASAEAFSALGYHGVTMEAIASRVGVSATALYRHYAGKYDLFRAAVLNLGQQLVDCTAFVDDLEHRLEPQEALDRLIAALADTALTNRDSGGLYRWEARLLHDADQAALDAQIRTVHRRIHQPLSALRPDLSSRQRWTLSTAAISAIGSVVDHRARLSAGQIRGLLAEVAAATLATELPDLPGEDTELVAPATPRPGDVTKYEALLSESMRLFNLHGYHGTSMEDIAAAVGMPASGIYRYFAGKSDILAAAFRRAADRLSADLSKILQQHTDSAEALTAVIDAYVTRSFDQPELDYVYYTERLNMSAADQEILRSLQRSVVEAWVQLMAVVRPDWTAAQARFAVHAAMALVIDLGRLMHYRHTAAAHDTVARLLNSVLLERYRLRTMLPAK